MTTENITGDFILLTTGKTKLLFPQSAVGQAEYLDANTQWQALEGSPGFFFSESYSDIFFIAVDEQLNLITTKIKDRFIVLPFLTGDQELRWCWHSAQILSQASFETHVIPPHFLKKNTPISHFINYENEIIYLCNSDALIRYVLREVSP